MSFRLILDPADTMAIGDGRPFNQADTGRAIAASVFPPPPDTVYGAARVACARALGWDGVGSWSATIANTMGDWTDTGKFKIAGPFFSVDGELLLPIPSHVALKIVDQNGRELVRRMPAADPIMTDLGEIRLLDIPPYDISTKYLPLAGRWGKAGAVLKLLSGEVPTVEELGVPNPPPEPPGWSPDDLAAAEFRVGLARDIGSRKAIDGHLYAATRRALRKGVEMSVEVEGVSQPDVFDVAVPLGGEARFAFASAAEASGIPATPDPTPGKYLVYFASPVVMEPPVPRGAVSGLPGQLVTASIAGVASHGGRQQDQRTKSHMVLPAGSVLFMESGINSPLPARIGDKTHMGYGRYFIGEWT